MKFLGESVYFGVHCHIVCLFGVHCHILHNQIVGFLHVSCVCVCEREREREIASILLCLKGVIYLQTYIFSTLHVFLVEQ